MKNETIYNRIVGRAEAVRDCLNACGMNYTRGQLRLTDGSEQPLPEELEVKVKSYIFSRRGLLTRIVFEIRRWSTER